MYNTEKLSFMYDVKGSILFLNMGNSFFYTHLF